MKTKASFFAAVCLFIFSSLARAAAPLLEIETTYFGKPYRSLTVNTQGEVKMVTEGKAEALFTLPVARVTQLEFQVDALTDIVLVDQDPDKIPCPSHFASSYSAYATSGKKRVLYQLTPACHRLGPVYPTGGQAGPAMILYENVQRLVKTLDLTSSLYYNLLFGQ